MANTDRKRTRGSKWAPWARGELLLQGLRYGAVGLGANALGYGLYLGLTALGVDPKAAMTVVFAGAVLMTFVANYSWSFRASISMRTALPRYALVYAAGYAINWFGLWLLTDRMGYPHQWVQLAMIVLVAVFLFAGLRVWALR